MLLRWGPFLGVVLALLLLSCCCVHVTEALSTRGHEIVDDRGATITFKVGGCVGGLSWAGPLRAAGSNDQKCYDS